MSATRRPLVTLMLGAVGIVYGDIGTSVLYALKQVFSAGNLSLSPDHVYGVLSLLFWMVTLIVTLKYVVLVLRADNKGEGGTLAMLALASQAVVNRPRLRRILFAIGVFGAALFYGDGIITPAISVLSAIEGLTLVAPWSAPYIVPATLGVLLALFMVQRRGTEGIGRYFGPVMLLWFVVIGALGLGQILVHPQVVWAVMPVHAIRFVAQQPGTVFMLLGVLVLCVTGVEALYADLGHFGRRPIRLAWAALVMPALTLSYFGQGAVLLADPSALRSPFYLMAPEAARVPLVLLATACTVIASQALISGAFSLTKQAIQLGYLPRLHLQHTSTVHAGQIYIPFINWTLFVAVAGAVLFFRSSDALAAAYGVAVCGLMLITTIMLFFVMVYRWKTSMVPVAILVCLLLLLDLLLSASAAMKIPTGGWFPLVCALIIFVLMRTWHQGRIALLRARHAGAVELSGLVSQALMSSTTRVKGIAVFFTAHPRRAPGALLHNIKHNKVLHEFNLFVTVQFQEEPWVPQESRVVLTALGNQCFEVIINYGFKDDPDIPRELAGIRDQGFDVSTMPTSYFLGRDAVIAGAGPTPQPKWRKRLFVHMHRNAAEVAGFMKLPKNATVELGGIVEI